MAFSPGDMSFSLDLRQASLYHLDFLQTVDKKIELHGGQAVEYAIQRYEKLWLPLAAKYSDRVLVAPLDIEWVWHCHLLNPLAYEKDCQRVVGTVVDHRILDRERRKQSLQESRVLWRREYPSVPFEADGPISPWFDSEFASVTKISYNLIAAVARQKIFYYQVSLPHYRDEKFLNQALVRYKRFLHLKKKHPHVFIVPCYDIDLIWHTHMLHPFSYRHDTVSILSYLFNHDDSVNDRRAGSKLTVSDARTRHLWKKTFNEPFAQSGAMFRGEPPAGKLFHMDAADFAALVTKQTTVLLESARVVGLPEQSQVQYKLKLWYNTGYQNFNRALYVSDSIATVRGSPRHMTNDIRLNANFTFDTKYNDVVMVDLLQKSGRFCLGVTEEIGSARLRMLDKIQALGNGRGVTMQDYVDMGDGVGVELQWSVAPPTTGGCILALKSGNYQDCIMPETVESIWGPVPLPRLPPGVENKCSVASHSLLNHTKRVVFTCRIIHSLPLMMSAVHVFYKDKMTAVGHLIGADQLPLPELVKNRSRCVTLDMKNGERAVLLKNHSGDWGMVLGRWTGTHKPVVAQPASATSNGHRRLPGDPGHLEVRFFKFSNKQWTFLSFERNYTGSEHKFQIESATVELDTGMIEISGDAGNEVAENLALAFSVALLHVLCQPRPKDWDPSKIEEDEVDGELPKPRRRLPAESLMLVMAAGFLALAPSNHLLRKRHLEAVQARAEEEARRTRQQQHTQEEDDEQRDRGMSAFGRHNGEEYSSFYGGMEGVNHSEVHDVIAIVSAEEGASDALPTVRESSREDLEAYGEAAEERGNTQGEVLNNHSDSQNGDVVDSGVNSASLDDGLLPLGEENDSSNTETAHNMSEDSAADHLGLSNGLSYGGQHGVSSVENGLHMLHLEENDIGMGSHAGMGKDSDDFNDDFFPPPPPLESHFQYEDCQAMANGIDGFDDFPDDPPPPADFFTGYDQANGDILGEEYSHHDVYSHDNVREIHEDGGDRYVNHIPGSDFEHLYDVEHSGLHESDDGLYHHGEEPHSSFFRGEHGDDSSDFYLSRKDEPQADDHFSSYYSNGMDDFYSTEHSYVSYDDNSGFNAFCEDDSARGGGNCRDGLFEDHDAQFGDSQGSFDTGGAGGGGFIDYAGDFGGGGGDAGGAGCGAGYDGDGACGGCGG